MELKIELNGKPITIEELQELILKDPLIANTRFGDACDAHVLRNGIGRSGIKFGGRFGVEGYRPVVDDGFRIPINVFTRIARGETLPLPYSANQYVRERLVNEGLPSILKEHFKWRDTIENLVVNVALQHILDVLLDSATAKLGTWYVMLVNASSAGETYAAADTMSSHAGWAEDQTYDESVRQEFTDVRTAQSVDNSAAKAIFTMSGTTTIAGAAMTSSNTKGGTSGTLLCCGDFTGGDKVVADDDSLQVTYTFTAADDGV